MKGKRPGRARLALWLAVILAGCASSKSLRAGRIAEQSGRYEEAIEYYTQAVSQDPDNPKYRRDLERAKLRASAAHSLEASRLIAAGDLESAKKELEQAVALNPTSTRLASDLARLNGAIEAGDIARARAPIETLKEQARERPLGQLHIAPAAERPTGFIFRDASLRDVLLSLGKLAGVNIIFDPDFSDQTISIELEDATFEEALRSLCRITQNFYQVQDQNVVTIIPDTVEKRREYEQLLTRTFYLSSADSKETLDLLRIVLGARRVAPLSASNAITMVDTPERIAAAERIIDTLDKNRAEVVIEVELLEVNRSRMDEYGIRLRSADSEGITTTVFPSDVTADASPYRGSNVLVAGLPGAVLNLLRMDSDTRVLANPHLRAVDGQTARAEFGERVPIPITTFTPLATGGVAQQPVTTFEYQNIGVTIEIVPRIHHNDEVSLDLRVQLDNISGTGFGGLPTFGNRRVQTLLRLGDGETSLLAGLIRDEERRSLTGIPALASVPVLGRVFASNKKTIQETDIVLTLTPHILRRPNLSVDDLRSHLIQIGTGSGIFAETPVPLPRREPEPEPPPREPRQQNERRPEPKRP